MKVLVACEFSGTVREAFRARGHDAVSCDLLPSEVPGPHYRCDVLSILDRGWDLMVAHPPCTHLCSSGAVWFTNGKKDRALQEEALEFFTALLNAPIPLICIENPVGVVSTRVCKPSQVIHPWQFGHAENKATCLWLKGLPHLTETDNVGLAKNNLPVREANRLHYMSPSPTRWAERSRTYSGIAAAMAAQWGAVEYERSWRRSSNYTIKDRW